MKSNVQVMMEALDEIGNACAWMAENCNDEQTAKYMWDLVEKVKSARAIPKRQCDVGSEEEQTKRYQSFCKRHFCEKCPLSSVDNESDASCVVRWGQMPYTEEGKE